MLKLSCPNCGFSKDVPLDKVPQKASNVTCPKCNYRFSFSRDISTSSQSIPKAANQRSLKVGSKTLTIEEAEKLICSSATWFWWIAGLSLVNSVASMLNLQYGMILGLGVTQVLDGLFVVGLDSVLGDIPLFAHIVHFGLVLLISGMFYYLGLRARAKSKPAYIAGMLLYFVDGLVFVLFDDWIGVGFHAFVLFMLWGGYGVLNKLNDVQSEFSTAAA